MSRRGGSMVEFALCLPVLVAVLTGVLDYGMFFSTWLEVQTASREATRAGASTAPDDGPEQVAVARAQAWLEDAGISTSNATITAELQGADPDMVVAVTLDIPYQPFVGLIPTPVSAAGAMTMDGAAGVRRRRGTSAIETAVLAPIVVVGMIGFIEYSWFFFMDMNVAAAARDAGRVAAGVPVDSDPAAEFQDELAAQLAFYKQTANVDAVVTGDAGDRVLDVDVRIGWDGITGLVPLPTTVRYATTIRLEDQEE